MNALNEYQINGVSSMFVAIGLELSKMASTLFLEVVGWSIMGVYIMNNFKQSRGNLFESWLCLVFNLTLFCKW